MNEIALSNDIIRIETEIQLYKEQAGQSIWEIGRRLNHVKENDLAHGEFGKWLNKVGINQREAQRMMKITNELPNTTTWSHLGTRALYLIATLPDDEKDEQIKKINQGENPTVKELERLNKQIKHKDNMLADMQDHIDMVNQENRELKNRQPEVIETEVVPDDYEDLKSTVAELTDQNQQMRAYYHELKRQRQEVDDNSKKYQLLTESIKNAEGQLNRTQKMISNYNDLSNLLKESNEFLSKASALIYTDVSEVLNSDGLAHRELTMLVDRLDRFRSDLMKLLQEEFIEGEIIHD